jgi:LysR family transcriptional activator of glutamate synthase operon
MELRQLETFREVVRQGSFTAAARALHMTQPAVSAHIKALEVELKARLLDRDGKGVRLTPPGRLVLEAAEAALGAVTEVQRRVRESLAPERGRIVLACGDTVALHLLPPVLTAFRAAHPEAEMAVQNHGSRAILDLVLTREADLGIVTRPPWLDPALWARTLVSDPFVLAVPRGHPLEGGLRDLHDLDGQSAVLLARSTETRGLIDRGLEAAGARPVVALESLNLEVVKAYVASGLGLSILPQMALTDADRPRMTVLPLPAGLAPRRITVVRRKDRVPGLLTTTLLTLLAKHFRGPGGAAGAVVG